MDVNEVAVFTTKANVSLDINKLCSQPFLQSIYAETLRLRVALIITRTPEHEDFKLGEWTFPANQLIALSSRAGGMNPNLWNSGTPENPHPLDAFWADRFLIYPNDPTNGPLRKDLADERKSHYGDHAAEEKSSEEGPRFSMDGVAGPLPRNRKCDIAQKRMADTYMNIIRARRANPDAEKSEDMIWNLMSCTYKDGKPLPD